MTTTGRSEPSTPEIAASIEPDRPDARDLAYEPVDRRAPLPERVGYQRYQDLVGVTWHQRGLECTGFALAAIANYHIRRALDDPAAPSVSRRMLYEIAQLHDGEEFVEGSTLRGALKGWHHTGVARDELWPYDPDDEHGQRHGTLTLSRVLDARHRPLFAYRRIIHDDIHRLKLALAEGHTLFASARLHVGWYRLFMPDAAPRIERRPGDADKGGHAFVIVGYDDDGLWVHNSWGPEWGSEGYALLPYDDWLANGHDVWVVDVAAERRAVQGPAQQAPTASDVAAYRDMWPHLAILRDDGRLSSDGTYEMDLGSLKTMLFLFQERTVDWPRRRLAVISDSGYAPTAETIERYRTIRDRYLRSGIYPIFVLWETSWWPDLVDDVDVWHTRLGEVSGDDDVPTIQALRKRSAIRPIWNEIERRAVAACAAGGGAQLLADVITNKRRQIWFDLHLVSHGTGDLLQAALAEQMPAPVTTASLLAPATSVEQAQRAYLPLLDHGLLEQLSVIIIDPSSETTERVGPIEGSPLDAIDRLIVGGDTDHDRRSGRADADTTPWNRHERSGRLERITLHGHRHLDLSFSPDVNERLISSMLERQSTADSARPVGPPPRRPSGTPTDPLAAAIARVHRT